MKQYFFVFAGQGEKFFFLVQTAAMPCVMRWSGMPDLCCFFFDFSFVRPEPESLVCLWYEFSVLKIIYKQTI